MTPATGIVLCLAYLAGLLLAALWSSAIAIGSFLIPWASILCLGLGIGLAVPLAQRWRRGPRAWIWLVAGVLACLAALYLNWRTPAPALNDISQFLERTQAIAPTQVLTGRVTEEPSLNRRLSGRFLLAADKLRVLDAAGQTTFQVPVTGRAYVTAPLLQVTGLHRGQRIEARGRLYAPQPAKNPNGFDFENYLAQKRTFSGFVADDLAFSKSPGWGLWRLRQRIVRAQIRALGSPAGQLVSAMALGRQAVDLPFDVRDLFARVGLAHTIAASGFHVSLLLGTVMALARSRSPRQQGLLGSATLVGYAVLTGAPASVVRAVLMGLAALTGLMTNRKVKPLGALLLAVTLMLLWDPTWIRDIGFQLSVAATFGLIVTANPLAQRFTWLPVTIASLIAVPLAATLWTLPLLLYHFNTVSLISIGLNAVTTPLIMFISLGGMMSSVVAAVTPAVGTILAQILYYPVRVLMGLAEVSSHLPGSAIAVSQIALWQVVGLYALMLLVWLGSNHRHRALASLVCLLLVLLPLGLHIISQRQITILAASGEFIWLLQNQGHTTLVNSGSEETAFYTVQPFLKQAGVNRLATAIAPALPQDYPAGWQTVLQETPATQFYGADFPDTAVAAEHYALPVGQSTTAGDVTIQMLGTENPILRLQFQTQNWLMLPPLPLYLQDYLAAGAGSMLPSDVLAWSGDELSESLLSAVQPAIAICYGNELPEFLERQLEQRNIRVFWTERDGAVTWRPKSGFRSYRETDSRNRLPLG